MGRYVELGGFKDDNFKRNYFVDNNAIDTEQKIDNFYSLFQNTDIYRSIFSFSDIKFNETLLYGPFYLDFDIQIKSPKDFRMVARDTLLITTMIEEEMGLSEDVIKIYFSGSKGFHVIIDPEIFGAKPSYNLNMIYKRMAIFFNKHTMYNTIDINIYDQRRLFRIENSINKKTGLYKVRISRKDLLNITTIQDIQKYASSKKEILSDNKIESFHARLFFNRFKLIEDCKAINQKKSKKPAKLFFATKKILPCVQKIIKEGITKGNRNNTSVSITSSLIQSGFDRNEIEEYIHEWNKLNSPPLSNKELTSTINSAFTLAYQEKYYGCTFFKERGQCVDGCRLLEED